MFTRFHYLLLAAAGLLLVLGLVRQHGPVMDNLQQPWRNSQNSVAAPKADAVTPSTPEKPPASKPLSFKEIGTKFGTDKVTYHHYWFMYDKYLEPIRNKKVKMLEIGLGCNMEYGPGKSYYTWLEYFPNVELYYIEYDAACAAKWSAETIGATVYTGDQADKEFLHKFITETGGNFDVIVDDGGHTMNQQRVSLEELWKIVKPGGVYFCEDMETSYLSQYQGDASGGKDPAIPTMMKFVYELLDDKMSDGDRHPISKEIRSIDCMRQVCALTKKETGTV